MQKTTARNLLIAANIAIAVLLIGSCYFSGPDLSPKNNWQWQDEWPQSPFKEPLQQSPIDPQPKQEPKPEAEVQLRADSIAGGQALAKQHRKNMLITFHAEWCGPCRQMQTTTFADAGVKASLLDFVMVDVDSDKNREAVKQFKVTALPTNVIVSSDGRLVDSIEGYRAADSFRIWLDEYSGSRDPAPAYRALLGISVLPETN